MAAGYVQRDLQSAGESMTASNALQRLSLHTAIEVADGVAKRLDETGSRFSALADHAQTIATRLSGPYPTEAPKSDTGGKEPSCGPMPSVDAINAAVSDLHPRVSSLDPSFQRLARALEVIERAIG